MEAPLRCPSCGGPLVVLDVGLRTERLQCDPEQLFWPSHVGVDWPAELAAR